MAITGLDLFAEQFKECNEEYILIGGSACFLNLDEFSLDFRATKDLDIVLIVDIGFVKEGFAERLWDFIKKAGYEIKQKSHEKPILYRFREPKNKSYPYMLELFSRKLEVSSLPDNSKLSPIPIDGKLSSLSAILLNDDYYDLILQYKKDERGLSFASVESLIPLKVKAFLNLKNAKENGEKVDSGDIKKHKNDVFRLSQILTEDAEVNLSETVKKDIKEFITISEKEQPDLKKLGIRGASFNEIIDALRNTYALDVE